MVTLLTVTKNWGGGTPQVSINRRIDSRDISNNRLYTIKRNRPFPNIDGSPKYYAEKEESRAGSY